MKYVRKRKTDSVYQHTHVESEKLVDDLVCKAETVTQTQGTNMDTEGGRRRWDESGDWN